MVGIYDIYGAAGMCLFFPLSEHAGLAQYEEISHFNERELSAALDCSANGEVMCPVCRKYVTYFLTLLPLIFCWL